jgi:glycosyltransferase involved in cell wall biosynthesis
MKIIVPCYNPQPDWARLLADRCATLRLALRDDCRISMVLVNDGSTQGVSEADLQLLRDAEPNLLYIAMPENRGKGAALRTGVAAVADIDPLFLMTDVDFPYTNDSMVRVVRALLQQGGIVSGHREEHYYERVPLFRRLLSKALRFMLKYLMRLPVSDSQCGLKAMDAKGKTIFLQTKIDRYLFDLEFLQMANKRVQVTPVLVELREGIIFTPMGLRVLKTEFGNFLRLLFFARS